MDALLMEGIEVCSAPARSKIPPPGTGSPPSPTERSRPFSSSSRRTHSAACDDDVDRIPGLAQRLRHPLELVMPPPTQQVHRRHEKILSVNQNRPDARKLVGKEAATRSGQFTFMNYFDLGPGSLACTGKEGVKLYVNNLRSAHMERVCQRAIEKALADALIEGLSPAEAAKQAQKVGAKVTKVDSCQAKRILGLIVSSGWDFFEAMYFGGRMAEGFLGSTGTLFRTYAGGFHGEDKAGKAWLSFWKPSRLLGWVHFSMT